jgi:hypothetical protein
VLTKVTADVLSHAKVAVAANALTAPTAIKLAKAILDNFIFNPKR